MSRREGFPDKQFFTDNQCLPGTRYFQPYQSPRRSSFDRNEIGDGPEIDG